MPKTDKENTVVGIYVDNPIVVNQAYVDWFNEGGMPCFIKEGAPGKVKEIFVSNDGDYATIVVGDMTHEEVPLDIVVGMLVNNPTPIVFRPGDGIMITEDYSKIGSDIHPWRHPIKGDVYQVGETRNHAVSGMVFILGLEAFIPIEHVVSMRKAYLEAEAKLKGSK